MTAFEIKDLKKKGFSNDQIKEIKEAVDMNLDILKYVDNSFVPIQIVEVRLGLQEKLHVETGKFGAEMLVNIQNDGPVTITLER